MIWLFKLGLKHMFPPIWVRPIIGSVDDGFMAWQVDAVGEILDIRYMSESKRFWQYGSMFGIVE